MAMLVALRARLHQAQSKIKDLAIASAATRLLNELIRYAASHGSLHSGFYEIEERLTHQFLAEMTGLARETVTKTLSDLKKQNFIAYTPERRLKLSVKKITEECVECVNLAPVSPKTARF
jgi:CRP/FNR family transcriptional regulator